MVNGLFPLVTAAYSSATMADPRLGSSLSMILSENRYQPRIKCGAGFFGTMLCGLPARRVAEPGVEQMVLPLAVNAQIFARVALAFEPGLLEQRNRGGISGNAGRFHAVQPQGGEGVGDEGRHR